MNNKEIKQPCGAVCTSEDCKICEHEVLGGYCVCAHSDAENLEKALEVYFKSKEEYPFCDIVVKALIKRTPKKAKKYEIKTGLCAMQTGIICPVCGEPQLKQNYCSCCGQKLDLEE